MAVIGILSSSHDTKKPYIERLTNHKFEVIQLNESDYTQHLSSIEAVIFEEGSREFMGKICEWIITTRKNSSVFIYIFSEEIQEASKMIYLQLGANGYINIQESLEEQILIMRNNLQRKSHSLETINPGNARLIPQNSSISIENGEEIRLTHLEYKILDILMRQPGMTVTYEELHEELWGGASKKFTKVRISNLIFHLRNKIEKDPRKPSCIETVRSKGYIFTKQ